MENGYEISWTDHALEELSTTYEYLEENFTEKELRKLSAAIDRTLRLISGNPDLFPLTQQKGVRKVVIKKFNTLYYRKNNGMVEILSFFSNRQGSDHLKI